MSNAGDIESYRKCDALYSDIKKISVRIENETSQESRLEFLEEYKRLNESYMAALAGLIQTTCSEWKKLCFSYENLLKASGKNNIELIQSCRVLKNDRRLLVIIAFILLTIIAFLIFK